MGNRKKNILGSVFLFVAVMLPFVFIALDAYFLEFDGDTLFLIFCVLEITAIWLTKKYSKLYVKTESDADKPEKTKTSPACLALSIISCVLIALFTLSWNLNWDTLWFSLFIIAPIVFVVSFVYSLVSYLKYNDKLGTISILLNFVSILVVPFLVNAIFPSRNYIDQFIEKLRGILEMG